MHGVCGAIFSNIDVRDYKIVCSTSISEFPEEFELKTVRVKNQGSIGRCVATALSSIIEYYNQNQNGDNTEMSPGFIYGNRTNSDHKGPGMVVRDALDVVTKTGDVPLYDFPYDIEAPDIIEIYNRKGSHLHDIGSPHRISEYCHVDTVIAAKTALMSGIPLLMAMEWFEDMDVDNDGVLHTNYIGYAGGHCMFIYGWNERGWKVQNSWSEDWGVNGCFVLPYEMGMAECWAVIDNIVEGIQIKKPFKTKTGKTFAKIINKVANAFRNGW